MYIYICMCVCVYFFIPLFIHLFDMNIWLCLYFTCSFTCMMPIASQSDWRFPAIVVTLVKNCSRMVIQNPHPRNRFRAALQTSASVSWLCLTRRFPECCGATNWVSKKKNVWGFKHSKSPTHGGLNGKLICTWMSLGNLPVPWLPDG